MRSASLALRVLGPWQEAVGSCPRPLAPPALSGQRKPALGGRGPALAQTQAGEGPCRRAPAQRGPALSAGRGPGLPRARAQKGPAKESPGDQPVRPKPDFPAALHPGAAGAGFAQGHTGARPVLPAKACARRVCPRPPQAAPESALRLLRAGGRFPFCSRKR